MEVGAIPIIGQEKKPGPYITVRVFADGKMEYELTEKQEEAPVSTNQVMLVYASVNLAMDMVRRHTEAILMMAKQMQEMQADLASMPTNGEH